MNTLYFYYSRHSLSPTTSPILLPNSFQIIDFFNYYYIYTYMYDIYHTHICIYACIYTQNMMSPFSVAHMCMFRINQLGLDTCPELN